MSILRTESGANGGNCRVTDNIGNPGTDSTLVGLTNIVHKTAFSKQTFSLTLSKFRVCMCPYIVICSHQAQSHDRVVDLTPLCFHETATIDSNRRHSKTAKT